MYGMHAYAYRRRRRPNPWLKFLGKKWCKLLPLLLIAQLQTFLIPDDFRARHNPEYRLRPTELVKAAAVEWNNMGFVEKARFRV